ncbi:hypothetical protein [Italian clover phyllody phytoplasma]|uniref:hypothetical protein n=1 Tax=Italian clover phyllody phytoplasma TaxID=1196420 RepID=UPI0002FB52CB
MWAQITTFLGGIVVEELMFDDIFKGTYSDFKYVTQIATQMVTKLGMSDLVNCSKTLDTFYFLKIL